MSRQVLPFDMFSHARTPQEARVATTTENLYFRGQETIWDGRQELKKAVAKYDGLYLEREKAGALGRIFSGIMWGELAAWNVSASLVQKIVPLEAKLASSIQVMDESRHFYVLRDYLELLGQPLQALGPKSQLFFSDILNTSNLAKQILSMQLMVEPLALTVFQLTREHNIEPVLCDLLALIERDEARHLAFGVLYLPVVLKALRPHEVTSLSAWQIRQYLRQLGMLQERSADLRALGLDPRDVLKLARTKQLAAAEMLAAEMGTELPLMNLFRALVDFNAEIYIPEKEGQSLLRRLQLGYNAALQS